MSGGFARPNASLDKAKDRLPHYYRKFTVIEFSINGPNNGDGN
jgi:hypothetical protein